MTKEGRDIQRKLKVLRHAGKPAMYQKLVGILAWADLASTAGKPLTRSAAKSSSSIPSPFRRTLPTRHRPRSSTLRYVTKLYII